MKVLHVVGARPNFMKAAPVLAALERRKVEQVLVHSGQHYDDDMSKVFFEELGLPKPDANLGVGPGTHAFQTAEVMKRLEPVLEAERPRLVLVYGDVNSTVAAALVACKLQIPVGHVEAGLRSFDRTMPEEINRVLTDRISELLFVHCAGARSNLVKEGVEENKLHLVGNVMIDTLVRILPMARGRPVLEELGLTQTAYGLVTLHRPSNVDDARRLRRVARVLKRIADELPLVFPVHPRTRARLREAGIEMDDRRLRLLGPTGYYDFLCLEANARAVITDSGGVQEETTYLGVPCFTLRRNTERPITMTHGTNRLVGDSIEDLPGEVLDASRNGGEEHRIPPYWDGKAADRIADVVVQQYG